MFPNENSLFGDTNQHATRKGKVDFGELVSSLPQSEVAPGSVEQSDEYDNGEE
jgi:hypothetical protein